MKKIFLCAIGALASWFVADAQFVVTPKSGEPVNVEGNVVFSPNEAASAWSVGATYNSNLDISAIESISLAGKGSGAKVGDFYYSDGSWSSDLDASKTVVGVVFYVGNPAVDDEALSEAYPECIHGLVVGLKQAKCEWQEDYSGFDDEADMTVGEWIEDNTDYVSIATRSESMSSVFNKIMGYNNTMGIDEFNDSDYGWDYEVIVGSKLSSTMGATAAPEMSSGWYIPSIKEVSLLCSGETSESIGDLGYEETPDNKNMEIVNASLAKIDGAAQLSGVYWSSTEYSVSQVHTVQFATGLVMQTSKGGSNLLRPVLAF
ncbi:MAG: DUF1566 domain-containing protein [Muribaculaceae bacterium]|nr:DUF1566 domain-containing protein [Muribaculaceae bacterium]